MELNIWIDWLINKYIIIISTPMNELINQLMNWYGIVSYIECTGTMAGFELGSGMFSNATLPEKNAAFLRDEVLLD